MKTILHWVLIGFALGTGGVSAQGYPDKSRVVRIIVPTGPASAIDLLARTYQSAVADTTGLNVIVDNRPGAEGVIGVGAFLASPADGYTMLVVSSSMLTLNPVMIPNLPYDPLKDFVPLAGISKAGLVMNLGTSTTFKTARELIAQKRSCLANEAAPWLTAVSTRQIAALPCAKSNSRRVPNSEATTLCPM